VRENRIKRALQSGGISVGTMMLEFDTSGIPRIAAAAGAEFAVFDMEHTGWSMETIKRLVAASRATDMVPIIRPPAGQYHFVGRLLDVGAMGIVIPMMESADQAREAVRFTRYPPDGCRGAAFTLSHDDYEPGDVGAKIRSANKERLLVALIETVQGVERADEIAAVDGLDVLWIGQFDLTNSMGIPGQFTHPDFNRAVARVLEACQRHGKAGGFGSLDLAELRARRDQGFRFLVYTADVWIYQQALRLGLATVRDQRG
jgi:2-dehydro-3-deoxyglucarate aldolase/4-hydroxy-2-oxoheptanedioate aldolase